MSVPEKILNIFKSIIVAEELIIAASTDKQERYNGLLPQLEGLISGEPDVVANLANIAAALKQTMDFFWVGFYVVKSNELVLGPFQGPIACTRIGFGKGVCGASWKEKKVILVPDVEQFPGHIACSSASKSEIVLPAFKNGEVALVLDVDSDKLNDFDEIDSAALNKLMRLIEKFL
jgi:L-methionine (R)-S-oxide reductase